jgi:DNA-binding GntR family transcriptional regulator
VAPPLSKTELAKLMVVRLLLEPAATRAACETHSKEVAASLGRVLARQRSAAAQSDDAELQEYRRADVEFHNVILDYCDNPFLQRAVQLLAGQFHRFRELPDRDRSDAEQAVHEHQRIVDAFVSASAEQAECAMQDHLHAVERRIEQRDGEHPKAGEV